MGRLEKLRSRIFSRKEVSVSSKLPTDLSITSTSINGTAMDKPAQQCCTVQRKGGHLYWNEARRIYSDPTSSSTALGDVAESRPNAARASRNREEVEVDEWLGTDDTTDDDVFLDHDDEEEVTGTALESYREFAALQRTNGWKWAAAASLGEEVYNAWEDWRVSPHELDVDALVSRTNRETVYSGYWHGRVCVHTREARQVQDVTCFLNEVQTLSCIRHQNIQLFMGACVSASTPEPLLLIMSELKGCSLHTRLHSYGHSFTNHSKLRILHQIAEGMEYLHAKKISHGLLTTTHITLSCSRVCISLTPRQSDSIFFPPELTYLPPEYIRTLHLNTAHDFRSTNVHVRSTSLQVQRSRKTERPLSVCETAKRPLLSVSLRRRCSSDVGTFAADIFAFGTIVYELVTLEHPFRHLPLECLILRVGRGECQSLQLLNNRQLMSIIRDCWTVSSHGRPSFRCLVKSLEQNARVTPPAHGIKRSISLPIL